MAPERDHVSSRRTDVPGSEQQRFWNSWNTEFREDTSRLAPANERQAATLIEWLNQMHRGRLDFVEVGCGSDWLCDRMKPYGTVWGIDLSNEVLERSRMRFPGIRFLAGDFMRMELSPASADVVVAMEVLSHVANQAEFIERLADLLRPGGQLVLATQNRFVLERWDGVGPAGPGEIRQWVDAANLR